ncbi:MAG: hypothetical protein AABZ74_12445 [Cyanobacteriota bacterium]
MLEELKKSITQLELAIDLLKSKYIQIKDILNLSDSIDPQRSLDEKAKDYNIYVENFDSNKLLLEFINALREFETHFFQRSNIKNISGDERKHLFEIFYAIKGKAIAKEDPIIGIITIFEKEKINPITSPVTVDILKLKISYLLKILLKFKKFQDEKYNKEISTSIKNNLFKELNIISIFYNKIDILDTYLNKIIAFNKIKYDFEYLKLDFEKLIKNGRIKKELNIKNLTETIFFLNDEFGKNNISIGKLVYLSKIIISEITEYEKDLNIKVTQLKQTNQIIQEREQKKLLVKNESELREFKNLIEKDKNYTKVINEAKHANRAIEHSKKGNEILKYFKQVENEETYKEDKRVQKNDTEIQKIEFDGWKFKYGEIEDKKIELTDIRTKTIGVSLKELLEKSGLSLEEIEKIQKKNFD